MFENTKLDLATSTMSDEFAKNVAGAIFGVVTDTPGALDSPSEIMNMKQKIKLPANLKPAVLKAVLCDVTTKVGIKDDQYIPYIQLVWSTLVKIGIEETSGGHGELIRLKEKLKRMPKQDLEDYLRYKSETRSRKSGGAHFSSLTKEELANKIIKLHLAKLQ